MIEVRRKDLKRIVIGIDPAVTSGEHSDDTGIVVVGRGPCQRETCQLDPSICTGHGYVLADLTCHVAPREWARRAIAAYHDWDASRIVAEVNNGGDMVGETIHAIDPGVPYRQVRATRGKQVRAEPASALFDQGRCHLLGAFPELEDQLVTWTLDAKWSPDRLDAMVWALVELGLIGAQGAAFMVAWAPEAEQMRLAAMTPSSSVGLPRLEAIPESPPCRCRQPRFFEGRCAYCNGKPREVSGLAG